MEPLVHRAESGDEGSEIAARQLKGLAKKHNVTEEGLKQGAAQADPIGYYRYGPEQRKQLELFVADLTESAKAMEEDGISREEIANIYIHLANRILSGD